MAKKGSEPRVAPSIDRDPPREERTLWAKWMKGEHGNAPSLHYGGTDARNYLAGVFEEDKGIFGKTFVAQLKEWGYDITTLKFSIVRPAEHPWIRHDRTIYRQNGKPGHAVVKFVRCRKNVRRVMLEFYDADGKKPFIQEGRKAFGDTYHHLLIEEVERDWQPTKPLPPDWTPDELPPMFPVLAEVANA
jgi:hypothetical protein